MRTSRSDAEVMNTWNYTSTPPDVHMAWNLSPGKLYFISFICFLCYSLLLYLFIYRIIYAEPCTEHFTLELQIPRDKDKPNWKIIMMVNRNDNTVVINKFENKTEELGTK
jgi:hypothetical protein